MGIHEVFLDGMILFAGLSGIAVWRKSVLFFLAVPICAFCMAVALLTR